MLCSCISSYISPVICRIEDITNFHGSLTFGMVKVFQYLESRTFVILLNRFYFSIFAFMEMLWGLICTWVCHKMCRIQDITNFHGSLTFDMVKMFQYFESPSHVILSNTFYFSIFLSWKCNNSFLHLGMSQDVQN